MSNARHTAIKKSPGIADGGLNSWSTTEEKHLNNSGEKMAKGHIQQQGQGPRLRNC